MLTSKSAPAPDQLAAAGVGVAGATHCQQPGHETMNEIRIEAVDTVIIDLPLRREQRFSVLGTSKQSIVIILIQSNYQNKRDRNRLAVQAAIEDQKAALQAARGHPRAQLAPLTAFLHYHFNYLRLLE